MVHDVNYVFGAFRLETATRLLYQEGPGVRLPVKVYSMLLYFLENPGRLISRREIFAHLWQGRVVEDVALRFTLNLLRRALHDNSKNPEYILTVCKCGYRFLPEVKLEPYGNEVKLSLYINGLDTQDKGLIHEHDSRRSHDIPQLMNGYVAASEGMRRLVFIKGGRHTGKSGVIERFLAKLKPCAFNFLFARGVPLNVSCEPYLPIIEALEQNCVALNGKKLFRSINQHAPLWRQRFSHSDGSETGIDNKSDFSSFGAKRMLREGVDLFETLAKECVFLLILDNAQWVDEFTLDLINYLMFRNYPVKLMIVISYRPDAKGLACNRLAMMEEELSYRGFSDVMNMDAVLPLAS